MSTSDNPYKSPIASDQGLKGEIIYKRWLIKYTRVLGIISLIGLNLVGFLYLYWASKMKNDMSFRPKWYYRLHIFLTSLMAALLAVIVTKFIVTGTGLKGTELKILYWSFRDPPMILQVIFMLILTALSAIPLFGMKKSV